LKAEKPAGSFEHFVKFTVSFVNKMCSKAQKACSLTIHAFRQFAHDVEHGPHRAVIGEPVATAALVPDLLHPLPAPQDPVAPANN